MSNPSEEEKYYRLLEALADDAEELSDQDLLLAAREERRDVESDAVHLRAAMLNTVLDLKRRRLAEAEQQHKAAVARITTAPMPLPSTPAERRLLLGKVLARRPDIQTTLQFRDFRESSDADVEQLLRQAMVLGMIDEDGQKPDK